MLLTLVILHFIGGLSPGGGIFANFCPLLCRTFVALCPVCRCLACRADMPQARAHLPSTGSDCARFATVSPARFVNVCLLWQFEI